MVAGARFLHSNAFFICTNPEAFMRFCQMDRPFLFNLASTFMLEEQGTTKEALWYGVDSADYVFCNKDEAQWICQAHGLPDNLAAANWIANYGQKKKRVSVITQGTEPVIVTVGQTQETFSVEVPKVDAADIVDTNGCGDSFIGGFMAGLV